MRRVTDEFVLIIADRNKHVREFLRRELMAEGYRIHVAKDDRELLRMIDGDDPPDLVILDLEIPFSGGLSILEKLQGRASPLPVVIHSFLTEPMSGLNGKHTAAIVEKCENTDFLKAAVEDMLRRFYPHRFVLPRSRGPREGAGTSS